MATILESLTVEKELLEWAMEKMEQEEATTAELADMLKRLAERLAKAE